MSEDDFLTLTFEIGGAGFLGSISAPRLPDLKDWKVTGKPSEKVEGAKANPLFEGKKVFEYLLRPARSGTLEVPQVAYAFFNPEENRYVEVQRGPFSVNVTKGQERQVSSGHLNGFFGRFEPVPRARVGHAGTIGLPPLHSAFGLTVIPFYRQGLFPVLLPSRPFCWGWLSGRGWTEYRARHEGELAVRHAGGRARKELKAARASLKSGQLEPFHCQLARHCAVISQRRSSAPKKD